MAEMSASFTDPKQELLRLVKQEGNDTCADCGKRGAYAKWIVSPLYGVLGSRTPTAYLEAVCGYRPHVTGRIALVRRTARGDFCMRRGEVGAFG